MIILIIKYKIKMSKANEGIRMNNKMKKIINNKIEKQIKTRKNIITIIKPIILFLMIQSLSNKTILFLKYNFSNITLKIKGIGYNNIFSSKEDVFLQSYYPNLIYINEIKQDIINYSYCFTQEENYVKLIWNDAIDKSCYMFFNCSNITEIDLSEFNTSKITETQYMFRGCSSLTSLNLVNFDTSKVTNAYDMFSFCPSLTSLNISHFYTAKFQNIDFMFAGSSSLTSLNLSNFDFSKISWINGIFSDCINLEYINIENFNNHWLSLSDNIFNKVPSNVVICIKGEYYDIIKSFLKDQTCHIIECSNDWRTKQKKIIDETGQCIDSCGNNTKGIYEYNSKCYKHCPNDTLVDDNNKSINKCKCELEKCLLCPSVALLNNLCTMCNTDYYPKENDPLNLGEYINCYKEPKGYYLDKNDLLFKKCDNTCETCVIKGDNIKHNCLKCNSNFKFGLNVNNYLNCYNCSFYHYIDTNNILYCTVNSSCPNDYPILIKDNMECIKNKSNLNITRIIQNIIKNENSSKNETQYYDTILQNFELIITSKDYDSSKLDKGEEEMIDINKLKVRLTTLPNQTNNENKTTIDLGKCGTILRNFYNISNKNIYLKIIEIFEENMRIPKIEYDIYSKLNFTNLQKLNLSLCGKTKIYISIPVIITEIIDKLNTSSGYFNDICFISASDSGTDITLKDRRNVFIDNNKTICQDDCDIYYYNYSSQKVKCECDVKQSSSSFANMYIDKTKLYRNFINIKNIANINILICYKELFNKKVIITNIGFYILSLIIILNIISVFVFYIKQLSVIENKIKDIILEIKNNKLMNKKEKNVEKNKKYKNGNNNIKHTKNSILNIPINMDEINPNNFLNNKIKSKNKKRKRINKRKTDKKSNSNMLKPLTKKKDKIKKTKNIMEYNDEEKNKLPYELAIQYDKRTYCLYYISLIKTKHNLFFSFCYNEDYNSKIIKIDLFFISFSIYYTVNALFFSDDTMHKIYKSEGSFDIEHQIPIIIYSSLISMVLNIFLKLLAFSNDAILKFKRIK